MDRARFVSANSTDGGKVLKDQRSPRGRGRMGTSQSIQRDRSNESRERSFDAFPRRSRDGARARVDGLRAAREPTRYRGRAPAAGAARRCCATAVGAAGAETSRLQKNPDLLLPDYSTTTVQRCTAKVLKKRRSPRRRGRMGTSVRKSHLTRFRVGRFRVDDCQPPRGRASRAAPREARDIARAGPRTNECKTNSAY